MTSWNLIFKLKRRRILKYFPIISNDQRPKLHDLPWFYHSASTWWWKVQWRHLFSINDYFDDYFFKSLKIVKWFLQTMRNVCFGLRISIFQFYDSSLIGHQCLPRALQAHLFSRNSFLFRVLKLFVQKSKKLLRTIKNFQFLE